MCICPPPDNPVRWMLLLVPLYSRRNRGPEKFRHVPKVTQCRGPTEICKGLRLPRVGQVIHLVEYKFGGGVGGGRWTESLIQ